MSATAPLHVLELVRRARSAREADACPHCDSTSLIRWGGFSGRQRYRCRECGRTFSDFTGTPAAYCKRIDVWLDYARGMIEGETVRRAAGRLRVSRATAFRWRHRLLGGLRRAPQAPVGGRVEVGDLVLRHSEKGARRLHRPARRRGGGVPRGEERVIVVFGHAAGAAGTSRGHAAPDDPAHTSLAELAGRSLLTAAMLRRALLPRLAPACTVATRAGAFSAYAAFCRSAGLRFEGVSATRQDQRGDAHAPLQGVAGCRRRYRGWIAPFRGVATRYLAHYLGWFCYLERSAAWTPLSAAETLLSLACTPRRPVARGC